MQAVNLDEFLKRCKICDILRDTGAGAQPSCACTEAAMEIETMLPNGGASRNAPSLEIKGPVLGAGRG